MQPSQLRSRRRALKAASSHPNDPPFGCELNRDPRSSIRGPRSRSELRSSTFGSQRRATAHPRPRSPVPGVPSQGRSGELKDPAGFWDSAGTVEVSRFLRLNDPATGFCSVETSLGWGSGSVGVLRLGFCGWGSHVESASRACASACWSSEIISRSSEVSTISTSSPWCSRTASRYCAKVHPWVCALPPGIGLLTAS